MAVNNSGKPPVNTLADDDNFGLADLGRIRDQYHTEPATIRAARLRGQQAQSVISTIEELENVSPGTTSLPVFQKELLRNTRVRSNVNSRIGIYQESKQDRLNEQAVNMVGREFSTSAVNSYVGRNSNSLEAQVSGMAMTGRGYTALNEDRTQIMNRMQGLRQDSMSAAGSYIDQGGINKNSASVLQGGSDQMKDLAKQLIPITLAMQQLKQQGMDPKGRQEELARIGNKASGVLHANQLQEDMKSGQGMGAFSMAELKKKEAEAAEKLMKALTALTNSVGKTSDELAELNKEAETAAKEFKDINEAKGEKGKDGDGKKFETIKMIAGTVQEVLEMGMSAYQNVAINQPMQMVANTTAAANMENEKYNQWHSALAGNMHERQNLDWTTAGKFGGALGSNVDAIHTARRGTMLVGGVVGAVQVAHALAAPGNAVIGDKIEQVAQGTKSVASAGLGILVETAAQQRQTEIMATKIAGTMALKGSERALTKISGQQLQGYRDHMMGINETAGAMGGEVGEAFMNRTGSADFLTKLSKAGIGTTEFNALSLRSAKQMGSQFNENQIFEATRLERKGFGTADDNMQRMGMLSGASQGNSASNLGAIIEGAMQRGLNSSKALDMIVENTGKLGEAAMMAGAASDPSTGIANRILSSVDFSNPNKEIALQRAQQGFERSEAAQTNTAASITGFWNVDRNMKRLGVDRRSAQILTGLSTGELEGLKELKDEESTTQYLSNIGINSSNLDPSLRKGTDLGRELDASGADAILAGQEGRGIFMNTSSAFRDALAANANNPDKIRSLVFGKNQKENLTPEEINIRTAQMASSKVGGVDGTQQAASAAVKMGLLKDTLSQKALAAMNLKLKEDATNEKRLKGTAESAQAAQGAKLLGSEAKAAFAAIAKSGQDAFKKMTEAGWTDAAKKTADNFGSSSALIGKAAGQLETAAQAMTTSTTSMALSATQLSSAVADAITKMKSEVNSIKNKLPGQGSSAPPPVPTRPSSSLPPALPAPSPGTPTASPTFNSVVRPS
jgi:hypothetical protein